MAFITPRSMFQSTPARGGRQSVKDLFFHEEEFQSTPARGGRLSPWYTSMPRPVFQSTPARGGRPPDSRRLAISSSVSIHARTWRATTASMPAPVSCNVSIHARTWRATLRLLSGHLGKRVSIHARTWRATSSTVANGWACNSFNPRPHVAGDEAVRVAGQRVVSVSIHARTWRATRNNRVWLTCEGVSIHARTWRATRNWRMLDSSRLFQSTPARGGRP